MTPTYWGLCVQVYRHAINQYFCILSKIRLSGISQEQKLKYNNALQSFAK